MVKKVPKITRELPCLNQEIYVNHLSFVQNNCYNGIGASRENYNDDLAPCIENITHRWYPSPKLKKAKEPIYIERDDARL